jgi:5,10-methylenetetrahydromethanopterin reductase
MLNDRALGVSLPRNLPADRVVDFARDAERYGFDELWIVEDCFFRGGVAQAAVALAVTSTIHVGVGILPAAARNAAFATLEANTLAELFPGRVTIGVGHGMPGWMRQVGAWPASPLAMLEETIGAMHELLAGRTVSVEGRYVRLRDVALESPALVPPLVLAGVRGPKSLAVAGRVADGTVLAEPVTPEYLAAVQRQIGASRPHAVSRAPGSTGWANPTAGCTSSRCRSPRSSSHCGPRPPHPRPSRRLCPTSGSTSWRLSAPWTRRARGSTSSTRQGRTVL